MNRIKESDVVLECETASEFFVLSKRHNFCARTDFKRNVGSFFNLHYCIIYDRIKFHIDDGTI